MPIRLPKVHELVIICEMLKIDFSKSDRFRCLCKMGAAYRWVLQFKERITFPTYRAIWNACRRLI